MSGPASYTKIAGVAFPFVAVALAVFVFINARQPSGDCPPAAEPGVSGVPEPAPAAASKPSASATTHEVFDSIYRTKKWGANGEVGTSGSGSTLASTLLYRTYLQQFMKDNDIHSVVDAGCGDWESSQTIDWTGIDYKGYDIVESVIAADTAKYEKPNIHFFAANIIEADLPPADLLIVKHVLQHLPNADVQKFLTQVPKYKHVLVMNSVTPQSLTARNVDITNADVAEGGYRNLDITQPPFGLHGTKPLTYWNNGAMHQVVHLTNDPKYQLDRPGP